MGDIFFLSDHHFGHKNMLDFIDDEGWLIRGSIFTSVEDMDSTLVDKHNKTVKKDDKTYILGDFTMLTGKYIGRYASLLNGTKILVRGNHDKGKLKDYVGHFKDVRAYHLLETGKDSGCTHIILSHVPVHPNSVKPGWINVHGHTHERGSPAGPYVSVCPEIVGYTPISFKHLIALCDEVIERNERCS